MLGRALIDVPPVMADNVLGTNREVKAVVAASFCPRTVGILPKDGVLRDRNRDAVAIADDVTELG